MPQSIQAWLHQKALREFGRQGSATDDVEERVKHAIKLWCTRQAFRIELLASAARLFSIHWPTVLGDFNLQTNCGGGAFWWAFYPSGILCVHERSAGRCVARSLPGQSASMDAASPDPGLPRFMAVHDAEWAADMPNGYSLATSSGALH